MDVSMGSIPGRMQKQEVVRELGKRLEHSRTNPSCRQRAVPGPPGYGGLMCGQTELTSSL